MTDKDKEAVVLTVHIKGTDKTEEFRARPDLTEFLVEHWDEPNAIDAMCNKWSYCSDAEYEKASIAASLTVMGTDRENGNVAQRKWTSAGSTDFDAGDRAGIVRRNPGASGALRRSKKHPFKTRSFE